MKKLFWMFMFVLMMVFFVALGTPTLVLAVTATWTQPMLNADGTTMTDLAGWNLYETTSTRTKVNSVIIPQSSCTGTTTLSCTWVLPAGVAIDHDTFVLTAQDTGGQESSDSGMATYSVKPGTPGSLLLF